MRGNKRFRITRSAALSCCRALLLLALWTPPWAHAQSPYQGPMIDAHSHLSSLEALDSLIAAMKRHNVSRVALLGVGAVQPRDVEWIGAAVTRYPNRVIPFAPLPDPTNPAGVKRLETLLGTGRYKGVGEVHVRQVSRKIDRSADDPAFGQYLELAATHGVPVVIHSELNDAASKSLAQALKRRPNVTIVLAHAGSAEPGRIESLLRAHANLRVDLSGMHFMRNPSLASEKGPLNPSWKAVMEKMPDRFLMGIDVWAPQLLKAETLDRLMLWTRRVLGELNRDAAEQIAYKNAARLFKLE